MTDNNGVGLGMWFFLGILYLLVLISDPKDPPSEGYRVPVHYEQPLGYTERFSPSCVGPSLPDYSNDNEGFRGADASRFLGDWAWAEAASGGHCPVSRSAVHEQGVGE